MIGTLGLIDELVCLPALDGLVGYARESSLPQNIIRISSIGTSVGQYSIRSFLYYEKIVLNPSDLKVIGGGRILRRIECSFGPRLENNNAVLDFAARYLKKWLRWSRSYMYIVTKTLAKLSVAVVHFGTSHI